MGDRGIGNFRLLNGLAIEACPALFPCKNGQSVSTAVAEETLKPLVVSQLRQSTKKKNSSDCLKRFAAAAETRYVLTRALRIPFDDLRDTSSQLFVEAIWYLDNKVIFHVT